MFRSALVPSAALGAMTLLAGAAAAASPASHHLTRSFATPPVAGTLENLAVADGGLTLAAAPGEAATGVYLSGPVDSPVLFTAIGPHWRARLPAGTRLTVELSTLGDDGRWSPFHPVAADEDSRPAELLPDGSPNPFAGETVGALTHRSRGDGRAARYRVRLERTADAAGDPVLERFTLTFVDTRNPASTKSVAPKPPPAIAEGDEGAGYPKPAVWSRDQWGARPPVCTLDYCTVTHVAIHHTAGVAEYSCSGFEECAADVRAIQAYHMDVNGWCDVGYNYLASSDGALWEGRAGGDDVVGAHDGFNCGSMGVANMGYYHPPYDHTWTEAQIDAVAELTAWKCDQKGIDPLGSDWYAGYGGVVETIYGHRDVKSTACPGDTIYPRLPELRTRVDEKLSGGGGDEIVLDNPSAITRGDWSTGTSAPDKYGDDYLWTSTGTADNRWCGWSTTVPEGGTWDVAFWWSEGSNRNPETTVVVRQGAFERRTVDQQTGGGQWSSVGTFSLSAGEVQVAVLNKGEAGWVVICDAARLVRVE